GRARPSRIRPPARRAGRAPGRATRQTPGGLYGTATSSELPRSLDAHHRLVTERRRTGQDRVGHDRRVAQGPGDGDVITGYAPVGAVRAAVRGTAGRYRVMADDVGARAIRAAAALGRDGGSYGEVGRIRHGSA